MELWDLYDRDKKKTGKTMKRGEPFKEESFHLAVHVCVFNSKDEMIIQKRQTFKEGWPNMWDITAGGSAVAKESSQEAAERELFEEIGYKMNLSNMRPHLTTSFEVGFNDFYLVETEVEIDKLKLQAQEVQQVKWASKNEIILMIDNGEFIPYYRSFIELIFDMRQKYSVLQKHI